MAATSTTTVPPLAPYHHHHHVHGGGSSSNNGNVEYDVDAVTLRMIQQRLDSVHTRTTARAAREFFSSSSSSSSTLPQQEQENAVLDWKSLPQRVERLCEVLDGWSAQRGSFEELPYSFCVDDPQEARRIALTAAIMASAPNTFNAAFESLFRACIHAQDNKINNNNDADNSKDDDENENTTDPSFVISEAIHLRFMDNLRTLGWIRRTPSGLVRAALLQAISKSLLAKIHQTIAKDYETVGLYDKVQAWRNAVIAPWLLNDVLMLNNNNNMNDNLEIEDSPASWRQRLETMSAECYCRVRMCEMFDMVADYPDSHVAVVELRHVLESTPCNSSSNNGGTTLSSSSPLQQNLQLQLQHQVGQVLRSSLIRRLNHPGANTSQIIDVYIATIKVLRVIDPTDLLLGIVAEPVRSYLRGRSDTVRCIISSLTNAEVGGELYQELRRQDAKPLENVTVDSDDEEECPDFSWQPPPSIHKPRGSCGTYMDHPTTTASSSAAGGGGGGDGDILAMLVSIYGSKELFVNEYRLMLADKLLANLDYNTDKEVHTLELLKLRFGEMSMRNCEVMIKDMDDSKRANANIHSTLETRRSTTTTTANNNNNNAVVTDVAMISHIFWPTLQNDALKHHPRIQAQLDEFSCEYARLKNPRKLVWLDQLGVVQLELDVIEENTTTHGSSSGNGPPPPVVLETKEFMCTPLLATLISHFEDKPRWSVEDLSNETGIAEHILQKKMTYWINNRVVKVVGNNNSSSTTASTTPSSGIVGGSSANNPIIYEIATHSHMQEADRDMDNTMMMMDEDYDGHSSHHQAVSATAQEEEEIQVYESYIMGMLTNLQQLPLERIHNMLKMFVAGSDHKYNKTPQQLSVFLQHLCKQEKLECGPDGMYKLFKK